jgi:hypothetical protein
MAFSQNSFSNFIPTNQLAKPLHIQRLEKSLDMKPFMIFAQNVLSQPLTDDTDSSDSEKFSTTAQKHFHGVATSREGKK